jgi:hypothetical protein
MQRGRGQILEHQANPDVAIWQSQPTESQLVSGQMEAEKGDQGVQAPKQVQKKAPPLEQKVTTSNLSLTLSKPKIDPRYRSLTCYNFGEPGHFVGICTKAKVCFICVTLGHYMTACPFWKTPQPVAAYIGSASRGLGFYHIGLHEAETNRWLNLTNCGVVKIIRGVVSLAEIEKELSYIFCKEWPWQIRERTPTRFLVRFPPQRKVADIISLPSFNLRKEGVQVEVVEWVGDLDHFSELKVWLQLEGIPPKWCDCKVFAQMTSGFDLLTDVDWTCLFKSYEKIRVKIACRNP